MGRHPSLLPENDRHEKCLENDAALIVKLAHLYNVCGSSPE